MHHASASCTTSRAQAGGGYRRRGAARAHDHRGGDAAGCRHPPACRPARRQRGAHLARGEPGRAGLAGGTPLLVEQYVPIRRELAVLVARRPGGETVVYPPVETVQVRGICREVLAPAPVSEQTAAEARRLALATAAAIEVTGMLAV